MYPPPTPEILAGVAYTIGMGFAALAWPPAAWKWIATRSFVHKDEKVLPARTSQGFDQIIKFSVFQRPGFRRQPSRTRARDGGGASVGRRWRGESQCPRHVERDRDRLSGRRGIFPLQCK